MPTTDAQVKITLCDFSFHTETFKQSYKHGLDTYIFRLQAEGRCEVFIDGTMQTIQPGDLLLLQPGDIYELRTLESNGLVEPSGDYYVMCSGAWIDRWWRASTRPRRTKVVEDRRLKAVWEQLILERRRLEGENPSLSMTLLQSLCYLIDRAVEDTRDLVSHPSFYALRMKYYIEEHATKPIRLEEVAKHAGLSVSRTVHLFKAEFGLSVLQYVQKIRLALATELMANSPMTLEQVAEVTGFGSYTYFHRIFREHYGTSPGKFRSKR